MAGRWPDCLHYAPTRVICGVRPASPTLAHAEWRTLRAQQRLNRKPRLGPALSRSAYGAFMVQAPILFGLAVALRPIDVPAELKAIVVAGAGVAVSFTLAWLLISRVPGVARIL